MRFRRLCAIGSGLSSLVTPTRAVIFTSTRDDVGLDCPHLPGIQYFLEGRHTSCRTLSPKNNAFDPFECLLAGIAQIGQGACNRIAAVAARAVVREQELSLMHDLG